jgi:D-ribose pyranose/furanose isomerase RbsD
MEYLKELENLLPLLGHRNWILVVDKAYPLQSSQGISYLNSGDELQTVLKNVLNALEKAPHVRPVIYLDKELDFMDDELCEGLSDFKLKLQNTCSAYHFKQIPHEDIFNKLDEAARLFNVVVIKTESLIPYTSVFIELDCGYWSEEKEKILRSNFNH